MGRGEVALDREGGTVSILIWALPELSAFLWPFITTRVESVLHLSRFLSLSRSRDFWILLVTQLSSIHKVNQEQQLKGSLKGSRE